VGRLLLTGGIKTDQQNLSRVVRLSSSTDATLFASGLQFLTQRIEGRWTKSSMSTFDRTPLSLLKPLSHKDINNGLGGNCSGPLTRLHVCNITPPQGLAFKGARQLVCIVPHWSTPPCRDDATHVHSRS